LHQARNGLGARSAVPFQVSMYPDGRLPQSHVIKQTLRKPIVLLLTADGRNHFETQPKPFFGRREVIWRSSIHIVDAIITQEIAMAAIAKALSNVIPAISPDFDILKTVAVFCGVGLCVSLILASHGLDLSAGFF
jgi:hypothetical protein